MVRINVQKEINTLIHFDTQKPLDIAQELGQKLKKEITEKTANSFIESVQNLKKNYEDLNKSTGLKIDEWAKTHPSVDHFIKPKISDLNRILILKEAQNYKTAYDTALLALGVFALAGISLLVSSVIVLHSFVPLVCAGVGSLVLAAISYVFYATIHSQPAVIKKRLATSENFEYFIQKQMVEKGIKPSETDLLDLKLHNIYLSWKQRLSNMTKHWEMNLRWKLDIRKSQLTSA